MDLVYGSNSHLFSSEHSLLQMIVMEKKINFDIYYRDPKKFFSTLRISLHDWRKIETILEKRYEKEKLNVQQGNLALFRKKQGVAFEEESDK